MSAQGHHPHGHHAHAQHGAPPPGGQPAAGYPAVQAGGGISAKNLASVALKAGRQGGNSFLAHLLGLDHDQTEGARPNQSKGWNSAIQNVKLSDAFQGLVITPNVAFVFLFIGFFLWLYVLYFIRHHEPLAASVLGTAAAQSKTAAADRKLVAGIKNALPLHTSASTGDFYVPGPGAQSASLPPTSPVPPQPSPPPKPTPLSGATYAATMPPGGSFGSASAQLQPLAQPYVQPAAPSYACPMAVNHSAYMVPVTAGAGTRVKMIVNR